MLRSRENISTMITPMTRPSTVDIALTVAAPNRQPRVQAAAITNMPSQ